MAALAARLNELATANEQGLLDDDEYRLLRQDAFERFASGDVVGVGRILVEPKSSTAATPTPVAQPRAKKLTRRPSAKNLNSTINASNNSIALFIRRATSPLGSIRIRSSSRPGSSSSKKNSDVALSLAGRSIQASVPDPHLLSPPTSPTRPIHNKTPDSKAKPAGPSPLSAHDIFEDGGLFTPSDIRRAIAELDDDAHRLVRAFEELEDSAVRKKEAKDREARGMTLPGRNNSVVSFSPPPPIVQHRSHSDSAAAKAMHTRAWSKSTTSLRSVTAASDLNSVPNSPSPHPPNSYPQPPTLRKKSSVSSLASSFFSLKSKPSLPSIPSLSSKPSLPSMEYGSGRRPSTSTGIPPLPTSAISISGSGPSEMRIKSAGSLRMKPNGIKRSRSDSDSVASSNSNNTSGASTSTSFSSFAVSTSGKGIEGRPSTSVSVSASGSGSIKEGRTSTNSARPSTNPSYAHTHTHALSMISPSQLTSRYRADSIDSVSVRSGKSSHAHSHSASGAGHPNSSRSTVSTSKAMDYQYDRSYDEIIPTENHIKSADLAQLQSNNPYEDDNSEIHQIQQRKRDVMKRYEARVEYLRARLRGAELHERVVKGR